MVIQTSLRTRGMELLVAYADHPSVSLRNQIVKLNLGLVRKIAHRLSHQCSEPYEDLEQIGYLGLIRAIERFRPSEGCAFSSFAVPYIRGEILHFLRDRGSTVKIPRRWQELQKAGQLAREQLALKTGRQPSESEIARALALSIAEWEEIRLAGRNRLPLSLDATLSQTTDSTMTLGDTLPDSSYQSMQLVQEERQQLQQAMDQLEEKTRAAIEYVYFRGMSRKEVADRIGVSPMTVTRRIHRGVQAMLTHLQGEEDCLSPTPMVP